MIIGPIREKIVERTSIDKEDGDIAFFYALMHQAEYLTKLAIAGIVSCLSSDTDSSRMATAKPKGMRKYQPKISR